MGGPCITATSSGTMALTPPWLVERMIAAPCRKEMVNLNILLPDIDDKIYDDLMNDDMMVWFYDEVVK